MVTNLIMKGVFKGKSRLGFITGNTYLIEIREEKRRGYLIYGTDDLEEFSCKFFCPYSSEISIKNDWSFE